MKISPTMIAMQETQGYRSPRSCDPGNTGSLVLPRWKRLMDLFFIFMAFPVVLPLAAVIALGIKCVSRGPVLFKQERIGYRGSSFTCFKFRSMRLNAETRNHQSHATELIRKSDVPMVKMDAKGDSRVIPLGSLLRASGLDELPQLINVVRGEMSLVGPRPCVPYEYDQYLPWQKQRFDAFPGLTGLWQVSGKNETTFNEMINLDIFYSKHASPWLDLKIISKTIPALLRQIYATNGNQPKNPPARRGSEVRTIRTAPGNSLISR